MVFELNASAVTSMNLYDFLYLLNEGNCDLVIITGNTELSQVHHCYCVCTQVDCSRIDRSNPLNIFHFLNGKIILVRHERLAGWRFRFARRG